MAKEKREVVVTTQGSVNITKDDLVDIYVAEAEASLRKEQEELDKAYEKTSKEANDLQNALNKSLYETALGDLKDFDLSKLGKIFGELRFSNRGVSIRPVFNLEKQNLCSKRNKDKEFLAFTVNIGLERADSSSSYSLYNTISAKMPKKYEKIYDKIQALKAYLSSNSKRVSEVKYALGNIPSMQRAAKAKFVTAALQNSEEGRELLASLKGKLALPEPK